MWGSKIRLHVCLALICLLLSFTGVGTASSLLLNMRR